MNEAGTLYLTGDKEIDSILQKRGLKTEDYKTLTGEFPTASAQGLLLAVNRLSSDADIAKIVIVSRYVKDVATIIEISR